MKQKKENGHKIKEVLPGSIAQELEMIPGDRVISIDGHIIHDMFDYYYYEKNENIDLLVETEENEQYIFEIEKEYGEELGIVFESELMDCYQSCHNKCIFCFIDQMPKRMRDTLYFKDDDSRLSFLYGNYVTLTNMSEEDVKRIIDYKMMPINISIQTMNKELRCKMLHNRFAGDVLRFLDDFYESETTMNGQVVLCPDVNDKEELDYTLEQLMAYYPVMQSVSVVPVGLTKYREGLFPLRPFTKEEAQYLIDQVERFQQKAMAVGGTHFVHASDEWYILAEREFPEEERYDGYLQLENGVGMMRKFWNHFERDIEKMEGDDREMTLSIATAKLAYSTIKRAAAAIEEKFPNIKISVYCIENNFFGEMITVSGLLVGNDIITQLKGEQLGERLLLPANVLNVDTPIFLDDITLEQMQKTLQLPIDIVQSNGGDFLSKVLNEHTKNEKYEKEYEAYEHIASDIYESSKECEKYELYECEETEDDDTV